MGFESAQSGLRAASPEETNNIQRALSRLPSYGYKKSHELREFLTSVVEATKEAGFESKVINEKTIAAFDNLTKAVQQNREPAFIQTFANDLPPEVFELAVKVAPITSMYKHQLPDDHR